VNCYKTRCHPYPLALVVNIMSYKFSFSSLGIAVLLSLVSSIANAGHCPADSTPGQRVYSTPWGEGTLCLATKYEGATTRLVAFDEYRGSKFTRREELAYLDADTTKAREYVLHHGRYMRARKIGIAVGEICGKKRDPYTGDLIVDPYNACLLIKTYQNGPYGSPGKPVYLFEYLDYKQKPVSKWLREVSGCGATFCTGDLLNYGRRMVGPGSEPGYWRVVNQNNEVYEEEEEHLLLDGSVFGFESQESPMM